MQPRHGFLHSNETDENITIGSKKVDWVRSFRFWTESVHRFVNGPNRCIKCNPDFVFCRVTKLTKTNQNITIVSKKVDCVHSFRFWLETMHRFVNGTNRCIKCNPGMVFCTVTKLTKTSLLGPKKWIGCVPFVCGPKVCIVSLMARTGALNATPAWFFA